MVQWLAVFCLSFTACNTAPHWPSSAAGSYRLDYSGVYGTGQIDLELHDGRVSGFNPKGGGLSYSGDYRQARQQGQILITLLVYQPATRQKVKSVLVVSTARQVPIRFSLPADLAQEAHWPIRAETPHGPIQGEVTRLP